MLVLQVSIFIQNTNKNQYQSLNYIQFIKLLLINFMIFLWSIGHARVEDNSVFTLLIYGGHQYAKERGEIGHCTVFFWLQHSNAALL